MPMEPPPSRYRVVERGGRLVVIDSADGGAPPTARDLLPGMMRDDGADAAGVAYPREGGEPAPATPALETLDPRLRGGTDGVRSDVRALTTKPPGLLRNVASTVCNERRDSDGRLQWTTARWFDAKGPRTIALSDAAEQQLGFVTLALLVVVVGEIVLAVGYGLIGFVLIFVTAAVLRQAKPAAAARIDRLAAS